MMKKKCIVKALSLLVCTSLVFSIDVIPALSVKAADMDTRIIEEVDETKDSIDQIIVENEEVNVMAKELSTLSVGKEGYTLTEDTVVYGDVFVSSTGVLKLNGFKLTVEGDFTATGSSSTFLDESTLVVNGNMIFSDGDIPVSASIYTDKLSNIVVEGNLIWNSYGYLMGMEIFHIEGGNLLLKGNYTDKVGLKKINGLLKVTGEGEHELKLHKDSVFYEFAAEDNAVINAPIFNAEKILSDVVINGDTKVTQSLDFGYSKKKLTVNGDVISLGTINAQSANLDVKGNLTFEDNGETIAADFYGDDDTVVNVGGDFIWNSSARLFSNGFGGDSNGIMNLKGNYYDKYGTDFQGILHMLAKNATVSTPNTINVLKLAGPMDGYSFPKGIKYNTLKIDDETPGADPTPTPSATPTPMPTPSADPTPGVDPTPAPEVTPTPEAKVEEYTIKLDKNTGDGNDDFGIVTVKKPGVYENLPNASGCTNMVDGEKIQYVFIGWFTEKEGGQPIYNGDVVDVVPEILYAHYTNEYEEITVKFDTNGYGTCEEQSIIENVPGVYNLPWVTSNRDGLIFDGWYTAPDGGIKVLEGMKVNPKWTTLYARYSRQVMFDCNGGYVDNDSYLRGDIIVPGKYINLPKTERRNYIFDGWNIGTTEGKQIKEGDVINVDDLCGANYYDYVTFYARYSVVKDIIADQIIVGQNYVIGCFFSDLGPVKKYKVTSIDGGKVSVSKKGILKAKKPGTVIITPVFKSGKTGYNITVKIAKPALTSKKINMTVGSVNDSLGSLLVGVPDDNLILYWIKTNSKKPVVKLEDDKLIALKKGNAKLYISVSNAQGISKKYKVTIKVR